MSTQIGSVSLWIAQAKEGDDYALLNLHRRYWEGLVNLARQRMKRAPVPDRDAEDVAQDAFIALYESLRSGKVPRLKDRQQWIAFLSHLVACRTINEYKRAMAQRRGGGRLVDLDPSEVAAIDRSELSPDHQALLNDCYRHYLENVPEHLRPFAELHLAGLSTTEIAEQLGCVRRTVERKLQVLREYWAGIAAVSLESELKTGTLQWQIDDESN